jgi:tetratricopeptide (TPR) repeat protein
MAMDAVSANPKCSIAYQVLCLGNSMKNLFRWGQNAEEAGKVAEEWAEKYFSQLPENYMAYFCLAMARFRLGRYQDALRDFRYAHERNVNDSVVLRYLAWCEASMGELNEAKIHAEMAIRLSPKDPTVHVAHLALAMAAFVEGDGAAFEIYCQRAIQGAPYAPIRRALMIAYAAEKGDERLMRVHREELMRNSPNFVSSLFRGENRLFQDPEHMALLLNGLRKAGFS